MLMKAGKSFLSWMKMILDNSDVLEWPPEYSFVRKKKTWGPKIIFHEWPYKTALSMAFYGFSDQDENTHSLVATTLDLR